MSNTDSLKAEENAFLAAAAREDFLTFCQLVDPRYEVAWFHEIIAEELTAALQAVVNGSKARIILSVPPRHGKTHTAASLFPAWALGKHPHLKFILSTYSGELSEKTGMATRDIIATEQYQSIFPKIELRKDSKAKRKWQTNQGGTYYGVGIGGSVTGIGGNFIILDDPHKDREEAESTTMRDKVWEYYRSTLYSRLEGYGAVIVIMQRWHVDDLVGRLREYEAEMKAAGKEDVDEWRIINFPAIAEEDEYYTDYKGRTRLVREEGKPLWEEKFPLPVLNNIRETAGVYNWASQYQQDAILAETQEFKQEYFQYFDEQDLKDTYVRYATLVDPAIGQKKDSDRTVVLTVAKEVNGPRIFRIREDAGRYTPKQTVELIFKHQADYDSQVWLETIAYQKALKFSVEEEQRKREVYFTIHEVKRGNKEVRIRGLLPLYQRGVIYHRRGDVEYEREALQFPRGKHDDRIDCMAFALEAVANTGSRKVKQFKKKFNGYFQ